MHPGSVEHRTHPERLDVAHDQSARRSDRDAAWRGMRCIAVRCLDRRVVCHGAPRDCATGPAAQHQDRGPAAAAASLQDRRHLTPYRVPKVTLAVLRPPFFPYSGCRCFSSWTWLPCGPAYQRATLASPPNDRRRGPELAVLAPPRGGLDRRQHWLPVTDGGGNVPGGPRDPHSQPSPASQSVALVPRSQSSIERQRRKAVFCVLLAAGGTGRSALTRGRVCVCIASDCWPLAVRPFAYSELPWPASQR